MKYFVEVNGAQHEVDLVERLGRIEVRLDGELVDCEFEEVDRLGQVALFLGERSHAVSIDGGANECSVTVEGHLYHVLIEDERERAAHAAERERAKSGGDVKAVMPGVVVELMVGEGDLVEAGQPLLILEAMKMQNEIESTTAGRVKRVHVSQGEAVAGGAKLVTIESEE